jgi:hypothetical protein
VGSNKTSIEAWTFRDFRRGAHDCFVRRNTKIGVGTRV